MALRLPQVKMLSVASRLRGPNKPSRLPNLNNEWHDTAACGAPYQSRGRRSNQAATSLQDPTSSHSCQTQKPKARGRIRGHGPGEEARHPLRELRYPYKRTRLAGCHPGQVTQFNASSSRYVPFWRQSIHGQMRGSNALVVATRSCMGQGKTPDARTAGFAGPSRTPRTVRTTLPPAVPRARTSETTPAARETRVTALQRNGCRKRVPDRLTGSSMAPMRRLHGPQLAAEHKQRLLQLAGPGPHGD